MNTQPFSLSPAAREWIKVGADGTHYPPGDPRTDHVAAIDVATGLMYCVESLGDDDGNPLPQEQCIARCAALRLLGFDDWQLATRNEATWIISDAHRNPAVDPSVFPRIQPRWHRTSTALTNLDGTASASVAWGVHFDDGYVDGGHRNLNGFALAVRRSGQ
jgi:hypothetical protein